jgi:hypothetical protein
MTARKDNRPLARIIKPYRGDFAWEILITEKQCESVKAAYLARSPAHYSTPWSAKRGMERFLRRIGADPASVRWEGEV